MRLRYKNILILGVLIAGLFSCKKDEPVHSVPLELSLCLPAQEVAYQAPLKRSIGDPGTSEVLELPKYAYIFITKEDGGVRSIWRKEELVMAPENWEKIRYYGQFATDGDYIYRYTKRAVFLLSNETPKGKIYAICSNKRLTLTPSLASISSVDEILNLKFNTAPDSIQENLQNIYSTPYNYTKEGNYYCTYDCSEENVYTLNLLLYHVAAKVDITWAVNDGKRPERSDESSKVTTVRLTDMQAQYLFNGNAYCFKPMRNEVAAKLASGYERVLITPTDEGLWWEGRSYFYTIPYIVTDNAGYFPLQMFMRTNGSTGAGYKPTLNLEIDTSSVFVPWLRADFNINQALTDGDSPTIEVGG